MEANYELWSGYVASMVRPSLDVDKTSLDWCDGLAKMGLDEIYRTFGRFWDPAKKAYDAELAQFQRDVWRDMEDNRFCIYLKGQKIGLTQFLLMHTVWKALTECRGHSIYLVSQTQKVAIYQLGRLKDYMMRSPFLRNYLVRTPMVDETGELLRDSASTKDTAVIYNPQNPRKPTRIYAKSITAASSLISYADVAHIHMTDISAAEMTEEKMEASLTNTTTRLLNTRGSLVVESPPSLSSLGSMTRIGYEVLEWAQQAGLELDPGDGEFHTDGRPYNNGEWHLRRLHWRIGVRDGTLTMDEVETQRKKSHPLAFERLMEARLATGENRAFDKGMSGTDPGVASMVRAFSGVGGEAMI